MKHSAVMRSAQSAGKRQRLARQAAVACMFGALVPVAAVAQAAPGPWRTTASIYGYGPSIGGSSSFPVDSSGTPINVSAKQILDRLKMTFMGSFEVHNGAWGIGTDLVYVDLGNAKSNSRDFSIGNIGLPAGTSADLDWDYKATVWTLAGEYRLATAPSLMLDLLAGARLFDQRQRLRWSIIGNLGPIAPAARTGAAELNQRVWDAIVGVKGRYVFGAGREWAAPFYVDVGAGQSDSTVQVAGGISYAFKWGELSTLWRYVGYQAKAGKAIQDMNFNGPQVGAVFRW